MKHLSQEASLLGNMDQLGLLESSACFLEFGAGKGGLSRTISTGLGDKAAETSFLLVDRAGSQNKVDSQLKEGVSNVTRIKIDIKDLDLSKVETIKGKRLVVMGKHLCGGGTDVSLRCALHLDKQRSSQSSAPVVEGFVIALCCHQVCSWDSYVDIPFIKALGLTRKDFEIMTKLSTWATSGKRTFEQGDDVTEKDDHEQHSENEDDLETKAKRQKLDDDDGKRQASFTSSKSSSSLRNLPSSLKIAVINTFPGSPMTTGCG